MAAGGGAPGLLNMLPFQKAKGSFVTLEQSILPGFVPPKPLDRVLKGDSTLQVCCIAASRVVWMARVGNGASAFAQSLMP